MQRDLIFDIGLHKGLDAAWYLAKGFRVVGVEAVPWLCEAAKAVCASDRLTVVDKALHHRQGEKVTFYVNPQKDDWGSLFRGAAEKGTSVEVEAITVETITLSDLVREHGVPYYIKCDIEGGDSIFAEQLVGLEEKPAFVSLELTNAADLSSLRNAGYTRFQIVNQWHNPFRQAIEPAQEGVFAPSAFSHETSGLFGRELPAEKWISFDAAKERFLRFYEIRQLDPDLAIGWLDVHAQQGLTGADQFENTSTR